METWEGSQLEPVNFSCILMVKTHAMQKLECNFIASIGQSFT